MAFLTTSEEAYAGPDIRGRTFKASHHWHIVAWDETKRLARLNSLSKRIKRHD